MKGLFKGVLWRGGAAQYLPGAQFAGDATRSRPSSGHNSYQRAPSVDNGVNEFLRNKELAAQSKARAEGDAGGMRTRPRCLISMQHQRFCVSRISRALSDQCQLRNG